LIHVKPSSWGIIGRVFAVVALTVIAGLTANTLLYQSASRLSIREEEARRASEHIVVVARMLEGQTPTRRTEIVTSASKEHLKLKWFPWPIEPTSNSVPLQETRNQMVRWEPSLHGADLRLYLGSINHSTEVIGALRLSDGSWLHFRTPDLVGAWKLKAGRVLIASLPMIALLLIAMISLREILRPLRLLAHAATHVGRGDPIVLPEQGPGEFRHLIRAYNDMQARIVAMINDRTQALAAVGHDLKTPLARLRLDVDSITDAQTRDALIRDVLEMEQMLDSLLTYFRGDAHAEAARLVDVAVMAETLVDDLQDRGYDSTYSGPAHCDAQVRPVEFKRALSNLADNASHYGTRIVVSLQANNDTICIRIEDNGPGVPEEHLQRILEPFQRLDPARQRNTAGVGLGLTIVSRVVADAGGKLTLSNRPEGGLRAQIELPRPASAILRHERAAS